MYIDVLHTFEHLNPSNFVVHRACSCCRWAPLQSAPNSSPSPAQAGHGIFFPNRLSSSQWTRKVPHRSPLAPGLLCRNHVRAQSDGDSFPESGGKGRDLTRLGVAGHPDRNQAFRRRPWPKQFFAEPGKQNRSCEKKLEA